MGLIYAGLIGIVDNTNGSKTKFCSQYLKYLSCHLLPCIPTTVRKTERANGESQHGGPAPGRVTAHGGKGTRQYSGGEKLLEEK